MLRPSTAASAKLSAFFLGALLAPAALLAPGTLLAQVPTKQVPTKQAPSKQATLPEGAPAAMGTIQAEELLRHAKFLASDELMGRLTGSPGQIAAANYIAGHFEKLGLEPLGDVKQSDDQGEARSFLQHYGIKRTYVKEGSQLTIGATEMATGFAVLGGRPLDVEHEGVLRFCGVGRTRGSRRDVPEGESLAGKIAVCVIKPPRGKVPEGLSVEQKFGMSFGVLGRLGGTANNIGKLGAELVLFVQVEDKIGLSDVLNYVALSPGKASVSPNFPGADPGMGALGAAMGRRSSVTSLVLSVKASKALLEQMGITTEQVTDYFARKSDCPEGKNEVKSSLKLQVVKDGDAHACNVAAVLRGSDPQLKDEAIVYSAHMDHVGMRMDGEVFNGADDNASGSSGLLAIASAYANSKVKPRRSIIFLSVSGEELGLWGSQFYSDNPTWQLDKIVANINTDMIGRSGPESGEMEVTVTPSHRHAKFSTIVRDSVTFAEKLGMSFQSGDKYYARSDHYNFAKKGIPVVFFCTGEHEDYHQVTDTFDKLDGQKMQRIARLAFWTGWHVAGADKAPRNLGRQEKW